MINGQADLVLGYPMDQGMKIKDATGKKVFPIRFADYGITLVSSGLIAHTDTLKEKADLVRRFMIASSKAVEEAVKNPGAAADAILKANPKAGNRDTLIEGFEQTMAFYAKEGKTSQPFRVDDKTMTETIDIMVEYGGLDPAAKKTPTAFYTNDYLPK